MKVSTLNLRFPSHTLVWSQLVSHSLFLPDFSRLETQILSHTESAFILIFSNCFLQSSIMDAAADKSTAVPCRTRNDGPMRRYMIFRISIHTMTIEIGAAYLRRRTRLAKYYIYIYIYI